MANKRMIPVWMLTEPWKVAVSESVALGCIVPVLPNDLRSSYAQHLDEVFMVIISKGFEILR